MLSRARLLWRRTRRPLGICAGLYVALHLALVPVVSALTHTRHAASDTPARWGLAFESLEVHGPLGETLPTWLVPGHPGRPPVLVMTGSGGNKFGSVCHAFAVGLHARGFNVLLADTRGQGESSGVKTFGIGEAWDAVAVLDAAAARFPGQRFGAVGFSLGAATLLRASALTPKLHAVAAYASYAEMDSGLIRSQLQSLVPGAGGRVASALLSPLLIRGSLEAWSGTLRPVPSPLEAVAHLDGRAVLLLQNRGDPVVPSANLARLDAAAAGGLEQTILFPIDAHEPPLWDEAFRERLLDTVARFLDGALPPG